MIDQNEKKYNTARGETVMFDPETHSYHSSRGDRLTSVTQLIKRYMPPFDADAAAMRTAIKTGKTKDEILAEWNRKGSRACAVGTHAHLIAESMFKNEPAPVTPSDMDQNDGRTFSLIKTAVERLKSRWKYLMTEYLLFSPTFRIAGQADLFMFDSQLPKMIGAPGGEIRVMIFDWKTCEKIEAEGENPYRKFMKPPVDHIPATKFYQYALQLGIYRRMFEEIDETVKLPQYTGTDCAIIHVHHSLEKPRLINVPRLDDEVTAIFTDHLNRIGI